MDAFKAALSQALQGDDTLQARPVEDDPPPPAGPSLLDSEWARCLARHVAVPAEAVPARLRQLSDQQVKRLKAEGRSREARELAELRDAWLKRAALEDWAAIKARFEELGLPERAYRALKQDPNVRPEQVRARLHTRAAEALRGASAARVREALTGKG